MDALLNGALRLISCRLSTNVRSLVPSDLVFKERTVQRAATPADFAKQKPRARGQQVLDETEKVGCALFPADLKAAEYVLVDAFYQELCSPGKSPYWVNRFDFAHAKYATPSEAFSSGPVQKAEQAFQTLLDRHLWRTKAYLNPFFLDDEEVEGQYAASVNLDFPYNLFNRDGSPRAEWDTDTGGRRIGSCPIRIQPSRLLRIIDGGFAIVKA